MTVDDGWRELYKGSEGVPDVRGDQGKLHSLADLLFLTVVGLLAGAQNAEDLAYIGLQHEQWFRRFLPLKHGIPAHDTFLTVLALVKPEVIEDLVRHWTHALREPGALTVAGAHVAVDGQALRGSAGRAAGTTAVQMVSAYLTRERVVLGSKAVDRKSNEIVAIPDLIDALDLRGATVTMDAMGCQTAIAAKIRGAGAHYVLQVKENQPTLLANLKATAAELARRRRPAEAPAQFDRFREVDKAHGRIETRTCILTRDLAHIERAAHWQDLSAVAIVGRDRHDVVTGKTSEEFSYFIVSDPAADARKVAAIVRDHWAVENDLHYDLDVTWGSDAHQVRDRTAAENFARMRRFCAGLVKASTGWGMSGRRVRMGIGFDLDNALRVLAGEVLERPRGRRLLDPKRRKVSPSSRSQPTTK